VTLHDVSPAFRDEVLTALELAHSYGVNPALLVVPNFHGKAPLDDHPKFCDELSALALNHEIYLHGFHHKSPSVDASPVTSAARRFYYRRVVSESEAEFAELDRDHASALIDEGSRALNYAGLIPTGFIAPAWSMPPWLPTMLGDKGFAYTEDHTRVYAPMRGSSRSSVVLNYASRSPARLLSTVAYCRVAKHGGRLLPARIAIHPKDMRYALLRHELRELFEWSKGHVVRTGSDLLN
jgi:predicted deacetylase